MDSSQLEAFLAVCKIRNFTKASEHLHISQSAVTARIKALESSIGKTLFQRDNRHVTLTQAGIAFLPYAERIMLLYEESKVQLSEEFEQYLVLSGPGSVWHYRYLQDILAFRRKHPNVAIRFLSNIDPSYMVRDLVLDGVVHVAVRFDPPDHPKVSKELLFEDDIILVSAHKKDSAIRKTDFISHEYCHIEWGDPFPEWFISIVGAGFVPSLQTDHSFIMVAMLLQGAGFGFLPRSIAQPFLDSQQLIQLECDFDTPTICAKAVYLTENREHASVKLGLEMLGASIQK
ncbi:Hca operon transcriptional activator HcaR [Paenibacillus allorhizoplanae]|uniref:Hca operon transcriptional activator HcaR n=1 Tax=Paenibacillus allorhizoplanae TaxID=2905648 RepID=A0ABN8G4S1_9BACL|nr:LysR family transcriptional regulator [Paenibacillus allorhizoplanae]CAH1195082.1 Hca operon transcriptional activator HcaR [Paenibacillus allorhizoplanae]